MDIGDAKILRFGKIRLPTLLSLGWDAVEVSCTASNPPSILRSLPAMSQAPTPPNPSGLRDNHSRGTAGRFLQENIAPGSELSFVSAVFTVHA